MRNIYFNLSDNYYLFRKPDPTIETKDKLPGEEGGPSKAIPDGWTIWDKFEIKGSKTAKEFYDYLKEKYNITIDILVANGKVIINDEDDYNEKKDKKLEDLFLEVSGVKLKENVNYMILQLVSYIKKLKMQGQELEDVSVEMPPIKYIFK